MLYVCVNITQGPFQRHRNNVNQKISLFFVAHVTENGPAAMFPGVCSIHLHAYIAYTCRHLHAMIAFA